MKILLFGVLLILSVTTHAAVTNELTPSDVSVRILPSDYGALTLSAMEFDSTPQWDGFSDPPISVARAIDAVTKLLPPLPEDKWELGSISLLSFDGKGWYYLVIFKNHHVFTRDQLHYVITKDYIAAVLMDGRVLAPSEISNINRTEKPVPPYAPQAARR